MPEPKPRNASSSRTANQRGAARLAAVQALYQMDVGRQSLEDTLSQFSAVHLGREIEGEEYLPADADFFRQIVGEGPAVYRRRGPIQAVPNCFMMAWTRPSSFGEVRARKIV